MFVSSRANTTNVVHHLIDARQAYRLRPDRNALPILKRRAMLTRMIRALEGAI